MAAVRRLVIGISGASGMIYAVRLIRALPDNFELHVVFSDVAKKVMKTETGWDADREPYETYIKRYYREDIHPKKIIFHSQDDHYAGIASGSFRVDGMIVIPCSMKTLSGIANGYAQTLTERAADVNLKERRPVVLVVREAPYNRIHLKNMLSATEAGVTIMPASPAFYHNPANIEELTDFIIARVLNALNIPQNLVRGWGEKKN
ncbi:MAG: UbiX family flavin prenyltransferase [Calditrichaceae bacterium]